MRDIPSLTIEPHWQVETNALPGETFLWAGQPLTRIIFHSSDWFAIPFSLMWGGFALFWTFGAAGGTKEGNSALPLADLLSSLHFDFFSLLGIPFVLIGQYIIWGRFIQGAWMKKRTVYIVTNKRVMVLSLGATHKMTDAYYSGLTSVSVSIRPDGAGTIEFGPEPASIATGWLASNARTRNQQLTFDLNRLAFFDIANVRDVYQLIQTERDRSNASAKSV